MAVTSLNSVELFIRHARAHPSKTALWIPPGNAISFGELRDLAARAQALLRAEGIGPGDSILLVEGLGPRLYAIVSAALALGACVVLVEPWMPVSRIDRVVRLAEPKLFLASGLGLLWGARVASIRAIRRWARSSRVDTHGASPSGLEVIAVAPEARGILTFTSGTTGQPKGVVRTQGYLLKQFEVLSKNLHSERHSAPDLCIFANFALLNLAGGRGTILMPPGWKSAHLAALESLPDGLRPESLTCGPAFLSRLMESSRVKSLRSIHVGGALTDCSLFERGFAHWPEAEWTHIYGSSEVEPVALCDARRSVELSRKRGWIQTLHIGTPVPEITPQLGTDSLWVSGPHVCPAYLGNEEENRLHKRRDEQGRLWHSMGDRVRATEEGWWYSGRAGQPLEQFELEQRIYSHLGSSASFVHPGREGGLTLVGENLREMVGEIRARFAEISEIIEAPIQRDRRHRARIDRLATLKLAGRIKWRSFQ